MIFLKLLYSLAFPYCMGHAALLVLLGRRYHLNRLLGPPVAFGLGLGILSVGMLILAMLGIQFTLMHVSLMQAVILAALLLTLAGQKKEKTAAVTELIKFSPEKEILEETLLVKCLYVFFLAAAAYYLYFIFWRAMNIPIHEWDSLASSIYNAKVFYYDGNLTKLKWLPYSIYPLHLPFLCVWTSLCLGQWDDQYVKIVFPLIFIAFTVIYYGFLRYWAGRTWAILGTLFLFSSNLFVFHATLSYRDLFLAYYTCGAVMFLILWLEKRQSFFLILAAFMTGFATFVKLEGSLYMVILSAIIFLLVFRDKQMVMKEKIRTLMIYALPCWAIFLLYYLYKTGSGISTVNYINPGLAGIVPRFKNSLVTFTEALFFTANWNIFWGWLVFSLVFNVRTVLSNRNVQFILSVLVLFLSAHLALSVLLGISSNILSPFTKSRLVLHFFPLVPLLIVLINADVYKQK